MGRTSSVVMYKETLSIHTQPANTAHLSVINVVIITVYITGQVSSCEHLHKATV